VVAAYQTLSDERTRAAYDQERAAQVGEAVPSMVSTFVVLSIVL
jgi:DnaJ-class molecular chaperone